MKEEQIIGLEAEGWEATVQEEEVDQLRRTLAAKDAELEEVKRDLLEKETQLDECQQRLQEYRQEQERVASLLAGFADAVAKAQQAQSHEEW